MPHIPIMTKEIKSFIEKYPIQKVIDLTFGAGGHSKLLLQLGCKVSAFDRDPFTSQFSIQNPDFILYTTKFSDFHKYETDYDIAFADLGMSTMQLQGERGFSFMQESKLDMRMDPNSDPLWKVLNKMNSVQLEKILKDYGEVKSYKKIASNIERFKLISPINTTTQLRKASGINDFKTLAQIFQAFRIFLNEEIIEIEKMLSNLRPKIGALFLTFHSLEDRLVKKFCKTFNYNGFLIPSHKEKIENPKSRSAKLRFAFKEKMLVI